MPQLLVLKECWSKGFPSNEFGYVLYPFLCIFKLFGFAPIDLKNGENLHSKYGRLKLDICSATWTVISAIIYIVGFSYAVHQMSITNHWGHIQSEIPFITSWAQIGSLFLLGGLAVLTSWLHLPNMLKLCNLIYKIDQYLKVYMNVQIDYKQLRRRLLIEFTLLFLVPTTLSMVNCVVIQPIPDLSFNSSCYWFICFAPIMLLTFKEFQFYNLLFILKSKYDLINEKLQFYIHGLDKKKEKLKSKSNSISEVPLASIVTTTSVKEMEILGVDTLQNLLDIFSLITDAVELVLKIFSWHLLLTTTISFLTITVQSYNLFAVLMKALEMLPYQIFFIIAWILIQILTIGINVSACSMTANAMSSAGPLVHKLKRHTSIDPASSFYQIIQIFSMEILHRQNIFTAAGFFDINYKLITSIIGAVTTYLVIIIQFHEATADMTSTKLNVTHPINM
ncbi:putative gustatory receptor 28b [Teleopsis dalmanni]|uniref:putative gustatory receptor 28b n=1 Tax=Teleopsis dalmanni TaxID=139649 RepID=UPI0018CDA72F|nr:putative gustatory receptor 28b [Teleopsis dalmanni]